MNHSLYSPPDLTPSDFWLFDYIKQRLDDHTSAEGFVRKITAIVNSIPKEEYLKTFQEWIESMKLCIKISRDHFEHLKNLFEKMKINHLAIWRHIVNSSVYWH